MHLLALAGRESVCRLDKQLDDHKVGKSRFTSEKFSVDHSACLWVVSIQDLFRKIYRYVYPGMKVVTSVLDQPFGRGTPKFCQLNSQQAIQDILR